VSLRADGHHHCDRCGLDLGNGDVQQCTVVITVELVDSGGISIPTPVRLEFCTQPRPDFPRGCRGRVLSDANLADYRQTKEPTS
jgi:hypothetical protein